MTAQIGDYLDFSEWFKSVRNTIFRLSDPFDDFLINFDDEDDDDEDEDIIDDSPKYTLIRLVQAIKMPTNQVIVGYIILNDEKQDNAIYFESLDLLNLEYHEEDQLYRGE